MPLAAQQDFVSVVSLLGTLTKVNPTMDAYYLRKRQNEIVAAVQARGAEVLNNAEDAEYRLITEQLETLERKSELRGAADRIFNASQSAERKIHDYH